MHELQAQLDRIEHHQRLIIRLLIATLRKENIIMATNQDVLDKSNALLAKVQAESNTIDALVIGWNENQALLTQLKAELDAAQAGGNQAQIDAASAALDQAIAAVDGNTAKEAALAAPTAPPVTVTPTPPADTTGSTPTDTTTPPADTTTTPPDTSSTPTT